jgi:hypothetical protein
MENSGEYAIVKILEARMKSVMRMLRRELNKQVLKGNSAVLTSLNTLNGDSAGVGSATGFFEPVVVGSQTNIVGGVSKANFCQTTPGWQNQFVNIGGAGLTGLSQFYDAYIAANSVAPMGDVNHFIMSNALLAAYRNELFEQERFVSIPRPWTAEEWL